MENTETDAAFPRITMHEYRCPHCNAHWRQQFFAAIESCVSCRRRPAEYLGAQERELKPLTVKHRRIRR